MFLRKKKKNGSEKEKKDQRNSHDEEPEVDSEGYIIRKNVDNYNQKIIDKFYSSSDESDSEKEGEKKLHFEIKPRNQNGFDRDNTSVDELKQTVKQLSIAPPVSTSKKIDSLRSRLKKRQICFYDGALKRSTSQNVINLNSYNQRISSSKNANYNSFLSDLHASFISQPNKSDSLRSNSESSNQIQNSNYNQPNLNSSKISTNNTSSNNNSISNISNNSSISSSQLNNSNSTSQKPAEDRYAALRAFFDNECESKNDALVFNQESNLIKSTSLSKSISSFSRSNVLLEENNCKELSGHFTNGRQSASNLMSRCESYSNLSTDLRMTPLSICSSRGPSPLTLNNLGSSIPIAAAIQEFISAHFQGTDESKCKSVIFGILKIAFPTGILQILMNQSQVSALTFKLVNTGRIAKIHCNNEVIESHKRNEAKSEIYFEVKMEGLIQNLKQSFKKSPAARYYNVDILKYQLDTTSATQSCPLQVVSHWKCEPQATCLKIDYKYNPYALSSLEPLRNVTFSVKIDGVLDFQSKPQANWNLSTKQICWQVDQISRLSEGYGLGSLRAKFTVDKGPSIPSPVLIQLHCANSTFSGINFELLTSAYRVSVVKKQAASGKYISEADSTIRYDTYVSV